MHRFPSLLLRPFLMGLALFVSFLLGGLLLRSALASWSPPPTAPPGGNVSPPVNVSSTGQDKASWFIFDGGGTRFDTYLATQRGNVGIGTTGPQNLLHISGGAGDGRLQLTNNAVGNAYADGFWIGVDSTQHYLLARENLPLTFFTNATERMRLSATGGLALGSSYVGTDPGAGSMIISGNVGIGTMSPGALLHVAGATSIFGAGEAGTPTATTIRGAAASGLNIAGANLTFDASNGTGTGGSGALVFRTAAAGATGSVANTLTERMRVDAAGKVGIGTKIFLPIPNLKLDVAGKAVVEDDFGVGGKTYTVGGLIIEKRTSDPASPEDGRMWLRTDIAH